MAKKKREWKAWMVVDKRMRAVYVPLFSLSLVRRLLRNDLRKDARIIRVRIVEA